MKVDGIQRRTLTAAADRGSVEIIDQRRLPHALVLVELRTLDEAARAIREMWVRGAPLIGATAAFGLCFALRDDASDAGVERARKLLLSTRPTAVNLRWALDEVCRVIRGVSVAKRFDVAWRRSQDLCEEDVAMNEAIGRNGLALLRERLAAKPGGSVLNVLTHCNAGWLATVDWGTALAPIYKAHDAGLPIHVWVDETRPRNQGGLTAWELGRHGVPHTLVVDNAGGHLMQRGQVDLCLVGTDRVTARGDVCNKIGTYLKALAARDNGVPFYVGLPSPTIDWNATDGLAEIPIEERDSAEVLLVSGRAIDPDTPEGELAEPISIYPPDTPVANYAFDVTPARLVTGLITERGVCKASCDGLLGLFPERRG
jgi:methylthioribose-1-phosphate isomerase